MSGTSAAFDWICSQLVKHTALSELEARGTVRLMLKDAGLDARTLRKTQLLVLVERRLERELSRRRTPHDTGLDLQLANELRHSSFPDAIPEDSPEDVFTRLGRS